LLFLPLAGRVSRASRKLKPSLASPAYFVVKRAKPKTWLHKLHIHGGKGKAIQTIVSGVSQKPLLPASLWGGSCTSFSSHVRSRSGQRSPEGHNIKFEVILSNLSKAQASVLFVFLRNKDRALSAASAPTTLRKCMDSRAWSWTPTSASLPLKGLKKHGAPWAKT
jgi:hypothetical protein